MKIGRRILCLILACLMLAAPVFAAGEAGRAGKRYNLIFVTDESGSMKYTDAKKLRYDAIHRFVALMAQHGNYLGSVTFDDGLIDSYPLQAIDGFQDKEAFMDHIRSFPPKGDTNIGLALEEAVKLLDNAQNKENPSVIILLSDGNTDLKTQEAMDESLDKKAEAIEQARQKGYRIYTICLNSNGAANAAELQQIAQATGGEFQEVKRAEDLDRVQTMYYQMIFGAIEGEGEELKIGQDGFTEKKFTVPGIGVEELNVLLEGSAKSYTLTDPSGYSYTAEELAQMCMHGSGYTVLKAEEPQGGEWTVRVYGDPGAKISFQLLYNSDFYLTTSAPEEQTYGLGQVVRFTLVVNDRKGPITDPAKYEGFEILIHLTVNGEERTETMTVAEGGCYYDLELDREGTYKVSMSVISGKYTEHSDEVYELNINNRAPVYEGEPLTGHANIWPFIGGKAVVDLSGAASDPDGDPIVYTVDSSAYMQEDYTLEGDQLTVHNFSIRRGSFLLRATDPHGASCTVPVEITSVNIGLITAIAILVLGLIILIVACIGIYKLRFVPFMGTITVYDVQNPNAVAEITPSRGRISLAAFGIGSCGLHSGARFQAGGKKKNIVFISKTPVYCPTYGGNVKKIVIDGNGLEMMIYKDSTMEEGIGVKFCSILSAEFTMSLF